MRFYHVIYSVTREDVAKRAEGPFKQWLAMVGDTWVLVVIIALLGLFVIVSTITLCYATFHLIRRSVSKHHR